MSDKEQAKKENVGAKKEKSGAKKIAIPLLILLLLSIGGNIFLFIDGNNTKEVLKTEIVDITDEKMEVQQLFDESQELVSQLRNDSTELSAELEGKISEIERIQKENEELMSTVKDKDELNRRLQANLNKIRSLNKDLSSEVEKLKKENKELNDKNTELVASVDSLESDNLSLTEKVETAEKLNIGYLNVTPYRSRFFTSNFKETDKAKKTDKIKFEFSVVKNKLAKTGQRTAYLRIKNPENTLLGKGEYQSGNFITEKNDTIKFSMKTDFEYTGEKEDFSLEYEDTEMEFLPGKYQVEIYIGGYKASESMFSLE